MPNNTTLLENDQPLLLYTACIADVVLQPLYHFAQRRRLFGYIDALDEIASWADKFHHDHKQLLTDWDEFEESELNIYNARSWDEFLICWANDQLNQFKAQHGHVRDPLTSGNLQHGGSIATRLIVVIKDSQLSAVYSNAPIQVAHLECNSSESIPFHLTGFFNADTMADKLYTLFDAEDPNQSCVRELLRTQGF